ncbi:MAG: PEGA domain-containing protein [Bacteroidota bacterium]
MRLGLMILTVMLCFNLSGQDISVKSFRCLPRDMDARVNHPVTDQNGDKTALIKVVTSETGFKFEAGSLGITKVERKTGEYWVYVPYGSRKITIKHDKLGVLRNYVFPEAIKKATVYEMVLTTGKVVTTVEDVEVPTQYLIITSEPAGATVFIDEQQVGTTTFQRKLPEESYNYRLEMPKYHPAAGKVTIEGDKKQLDIKLKPNFGNILVTSSPENNMQIYLDGDKTGKTTPDTLRDISSGTHLVQLRDKWYQSQSKKTEVKDEQTTEAAFEMQKAFAELSITTNPEADIFIDGEKKGNGNWSGRLLSGYYNVKVKKDKYYSDDKQVEIVAGEDQSLSFKLKGKTGKLDVITEPIAAEIYLDNEKYGTSPQTIKDLLVGDYQLELRKNGYGTYEEIITIKEDETLEIEKELESGREIKITSTPGDASVYINDKLQGKTPFKADLAFGEHTVEVKKDDNSEIKNIEVTQDGRSSFLFEIKKEISISSEPSGADIYINGKHRGKTPATFMFPDKPTAVKITKDGYRDKTVKLEKLPADRQISIDLDKIKLINGYSIDLKIGNGQKVQFGNFGSFGISLYLDRLYMSAAVGISASPQAFENDISSNGSGIMVNDIDNYEPVGKYYLTENDYGYSNIKEHSGMVYSIQAGYQFSFPIPFVIHGGYGGRSSRAYQKVYQAEHDYFSIDGYAQDINKGEYFTTPVAYSDGYNSLIFGLDIPLFGFLKIGAEYWINTEIDNAMYYSAGLLFTKSTIKRMRQ